MRTLALLIAFCSSAVLAAPFAVQVGDTKLALDAPPGFSDVQATGSPRLLDLADSLTSASNRILLFALEDGDVRRFSVGDTPLLRRYVIAVTPKGLETARVNMAGFHGLVADSLRDLAEPPPAGTKVTTYLDSQPRGKPALLIRLRNDQDVVSVLQGARLPDREHMPPRYILASTTLMLIRGKALNMSVYTSYEEDADLDWIRTATLRWVDELQRMNLRSP